VLHSAFPTPYRAEVFLIKESGPRLLAESVGLGVVGALAAQLFYTTSSTARRVAVSGDYKHDPSMPNEKEPTYRGVCRVALLLEVHFLVVAGGGEHDVGIDSLTCGCCGETLF